MLELKFLIDELILSSLNRTRRDGGGSGDTTQHACRLAANPLARLEAGLRGLAGQEKAADKLKAALFRHTWDRFVVL
jgi:hypothetical protein